MEKNNEVLEVEETETKVEPEVKEEPETHEEVKEQSTEEKTFTQEEVNKIVEDRLKRFESKVEKPNEDNYKEELQELKTSLEKMKYTNYLLTQGVDEKYVGDVLTLAKAREGELKDSVNEVLEMYPIFTNKAEEVTSIKTGNKATNSEPSEADIRFENMRKRMGLK